ncbi:MAG: hypothetical protein LUQ38_01650 [Methanotrichaceae archaeon]|nr:hypothetical protein [Methanotrichaceae archaeon]
MRRCGPSVYGFNYTTELDKIEMNKKVGNPHEAWPHTRSMKNLMNPKILFSTWAVKAEFILRHRSRVWETSQSLADTRMRLRTRTANCTCELPRICPYKHIERRNSRFPDNTKKDAW